MSVHSLYHLNHEMWQKRLQSLKRAGNIQVKWPFAAAPALTLLAVNISANKVAENAARRRLSFLTATLVHFRSSVIGQKQEQNSTDGMSSFWATVKKTWTDHWSLFPLHSHLVSLGFSSTPHPSFSFHQSSVLRREARGMQKGRWGEESFILRPSASCYRCRDDPSKHRMTLLWNSALNANSVGRPATINPSSSLGAMWCSALIALADITPVHAF